MARIHKLKLEMGKLLLVLPWSLEVEGDAFDDLLKLKEGMDVKRLGFLVLGFVWRRKGILEARVLLLMKKGENGGVCKCIGIYMLGSFVKGLEIGWK